MAAGELDGLFASLSAGMDAAIARDEADAADDLAFSLFQEVPFQTAIARTGGTCIVRGMWLPVTQIGVDFVVARHALADVLVPLDRTTIRLTSTAPEPASRSDTLIALCRRLARRRTMVEIDAVGESYRGVLLRAAPDHLLAEDGDAQVAVGLSGLSAVLIFPAGSVDEP